MIAGDAWNPTSQTIRTQPDRSQKRNSRHERHGSHNQPAAFVRPLCFDRSVRADVNRHGIAGGRGNANVAHRDSGYKSAHDKPFPEKLFTPNSQKDGEPQKLDRGIERLTAEEGFGTANESSANGQIT